MSVRRVNCPHCNAAANVLATMTNIKCPSCGNVWNVNNPGAVRKADYAAEKKQEQDEEKNDLAIMSAVIGGAIAMIALVTLTIYIMSARAENRKKAADAAAAAAAAKAAEEAAAAMVIEYREIDLPEDTRKRIYKEYKQLVASSTGKKIMLPSKSEARKSVDGMLQAIVDREIRRYAARYSVEEDDIREIVKEGKAKNW